ncbi:MAG: exodeoxyribonuclease VII large subunit [Acidaminococcaceae bacterium]
MLVDNVYSVSGVNRLIKNLVEKNPTFNNIQIQGELSNFRRYASGHCYFTLKDQESILKSVMFKGRAASLKFIPKDGDTVLAIGRLGVYEKDGIYQLYTDLMLKAGAGDLMVAYEALKAKLAAEGLFATERKCQLPSQPQIIGIITSESGAAVRDIITVARRRNPGIKLVLYPVKVQGAEAGAEIVKAIKFMNKHKLAEVLIVGRGGGAVEDLWAFNEEAVVRAIANSELPIVSAVGHEIDFTLADFAADQRAATPSQAAEILVADVGAQKRQLLQLQGQNLRAMRILLEQKQKKLQLLASNVVLTQPERWLENKKLQVDRSGQLLLVAMQTKLQGVAHRYALNAARLDSLSPLAIMSRGYSIVQTKDGQAVCSLQQLQLGATIKATVADGVFYATVNELHKGEQ